jgi:4-hydroxythreonine-4-phosphate dehydrogenase
MRPTRARPLTIVADDLTGACDTGALFAARGPVPVTVWPRRAVEAAVRVIDTESRTAISLEAADRVTAVAARARAGFWFKKIDSTLRGPIGPEVDALMRGTGATTAIVCPAFPAQRRVVLDRTLLVRGVPVAETPIGRDPHFPRGTSSVVDLLRPQLDRALAWIPIDQLRAGADALAARVRRLSGTVIIADAESDADLDALVEAALAATPVPLLVGSAGLARALAARLGLRGERADLPAGARWLVVAGSLHPSAAPRGARRRPDRAGDGRARQRRPRRRRGPPDRAGHGNAAARAVGPGRRHRRRDGRGLVERARRRAARPRRRAGAGAGLRSPAGARPRAPAPAHEGGGIRATRPAEDAAEGGRRMKRPVLGVTMGDPAGVGPEIIARAAAEPSVRTACRPVVIGAAATMGEALALVGGPLALRAVAGVADCRWADGTLEVLDLANVDMATLPRGEVSAAAGRAAYACIERAVALATTGEIAAIVTAPVNKEALAAAGVRHSGHTEILAELSGTRDFAMLLMGKELKVIHVTTHVALRRVPELVTRERVLKTIRLAQTTLVGLGRSHGRIAVAGLNPHAGEDGLFGDEEQQAIGPAIDAARAEGLNVTGPLPADTLFSRARGGEFDIVVAMYHDQGHIPVKTLGFEYDETRKTWTGLSGVNVTVGLPFLRVSVDHGTAFDRAWKGVANHESMVEALDVATRMLTGIVAP